MFEKIGFIPNADKIVKEIIRNVLENEAASTRFIECNNMDFHDLSRNHELMPRTI